MKKLMTSLLALLLCGLSFCWADVTVSGKVLHDTRAGSVGSENWVNATIQLFNGETAAYTATVGDVDGQYGVYTIENVTAGTYKIVFGGNAEGRDFTYEEENFVVSTEDITKDFKAVLDAKVTMTVEVGYEEEYFGTTQFKGIANATVTVKQGETEVGTETTTSGWDAGKATFNNIDPTKDYTISASASGYKNNTVTTKGAEKVRIVMEEALTTVSGTLKLGETALTELPEGMTLIIRSNSTNYTAQINENGYTANCKPGEAKAAIADINSTNFSYDFYANLSTTYAVTSPENGSFTIAEGETFTQNIEVSKIAANIYVKTNPDDNIFKGELMLTKEGEAPIYGSSRTEDYTIVFNGVPAGTYTLALDRFGAQLKGTAPTVTIGADYADQTIETIEIEAVEETVTLAGTVALKDGYNAPILLNGAEVKLYAANGQEPGDLLDTKTTRADGKFSFSQTISEATKYFITVTHQDIIPCQSDVITANRSEIEPNLSYKAIWISGSITNSNDLTEAPTIEASINGNKYTPDSYVYFYTEYDAKNAKYYVYSSNIPVAGTYQVALKGQDNDGFLMTAKEDVTVATEAVTKDLTAVKNADSGYMTIRLRYKSVEDKILPVASKSLNLYIGDTYLAYLSTDENGNAKYLVAKENAYKIVIDGGSYYGYQDKTVEDVPAFFTDGQGTVRPNDLTIYLEGTEPTLITYSGKIDITTHGAGMGRDVRIALQTQRDKAIMYSDIVNGTYEFKDVPVVKSDNMNVFLVESDAKLSEYGVSVPYNYNIQPATIYAYPSQSSPVTTNNFTVYRIGCNVSGTVSPATSGEVTLTEAGETNPSHFANLSQGTFKFQGVAAGTYTLNVKCDGYEAYATEITVEPSLEDMTVPAIALTAKMEIITVSGQIDTYNKATHEYFDGAKLEIWNSDNTKMLAETTMPASDGYGYIPSGFSFEATMGTKVIFKMTHPSIQPISQEFTVNGTTLFISNLTYVFVKEGADWFVMKDFKAEWNATFDSLKLSWSWPEGAADAKVQKINLNRKIADASSSEGEAVTYWSSNGAWFSESELPVAFADALTQPLKYSYTFEFRYAGAPGYTVTFIADMREGERYTLAYTVNDAEMGSISSYGQPEGEYMEDDQITVTAVAKSGYKFVEFLQNDKKLTEEELKNVLLLGADNDSAAVYSFRMPAENVTVKAVFATKSDVRYTVTLLSSNEAWGTVEGAGNFEEGTEVTVKAVVTDADKYAFVAWKEGDKEVSKEATYKFKLEKDITLTAVFKELSGNENLQAAQWAIFAEDGAIIIKGLAGDRYDIYDLNGRLSGQALCTGAEIRLSVAPNKLYIVRRISAGGAFDAKKIVVR